MGAVPQETARAGIPVRSGTEAARSVRNNEDGETTQSVKRLPHSRGVPSQAPAPTSKARHSSLSLYSPSPEVTETDRGDP